LNSKIEARELNECVACASGDLEPILDLGSQPLANDFRTSPSILPTFPLSLKYCKTCSHLQLTHSVDRKYLFENYLYVSGTSHTLKEYFKLFAAQATKLYSPNSGPGVVLDIASNDGSQLDAFKELGWITTGIDPAKNLFFDSNARHHILNSFLTEDHGAFLRSDLIVAQNVLAHTENPLEFLRISAMISPIILVQTSQARMIERGEFDTMYHEHISFFSPRSMFELARRAGLKLESVEIAPIHGDSFVFKLGNSSSEIETPALLPIEDARTFAKQALLTLQNLDDVISRERSAGRAIVGYGAAAKGMTVINAISGTFDLIIDDSPLKTGRYTPGKNIRIESISALKEINQPISIVLLAWNFETEIRRRVEELGIRDVRYVKYFPSVSCS